MLPPLCRKRLDVMALFPPQQQRVHPCGPQHVRESPSCLKMQSIVTRVLNSTLASITFAIAASRHQHFAHRRLGTRWNNAILAGVFLDVREPPEWFGRGLVKGAVPIPRGVIEFTAGDRVALDSRVVVYCSNGIRAALAGSTLLDLGYTDVLNGGSYEALSDEGIPTQAPVTTEDTSHP